MAGWNLIAISFIKITDATTAVENKNQDAKELIAEIQDNLDSKDQDSKAGKNVSQVLAIKKEVTKEDLTKISSALLAFKKRAKSGRFRGGKKTTSWVASSLYF